MAYEVLLILSINGIFVLHFLLKRFIKLRNFDDHKQIIALRRRVAQLEVENRELKQKLFDQVSCSFDYYPRAACSLLSETQISYFLIRNLITIQFAIVLTNDTNE